MNSPDATSSLAALRQLKEMLDAGTLTPQEFDALKQKLIFGSPTTPAAAEAPPTPADFMVPVSVSEALTSAPVLPLKDSLPPPPAETPNLLATAAPVMATTNSAPLADDHEPDEDPSDSQRNPLNLVFALGGALVFLAVVLYLTLGSRTTDEHLTSTTQTAADSARVAPEIGPQAQQLTLPPATPETVRVAPVVPPVAAPAASQFHTDSSAAVPASAASAVPAAKAAAKPTPATTVAADTAI